MEEVTLLSLMEADKDMLLGSLRADRSPAAAQTALEKAIDRLALRYAEQCPDREVADAAQLTLRTLRGALPLTGAVSEVKRWEMTAGHAAPRKWTPAALGLLTVGAVLILAVMLGLLITGGRLSGALAFLEALLPAALGAAALFFAGVKYSQPPKAKADAPAVREEFLIDPDKVWHDLRGMLLMADDALGRLKVQAQSRRDAAATPAGCSLDGRTLELFANLLENACALDGPEAREMSESIRFYLHGAGVDAIDYAPDTAALFEFLPAPASGTLRPALVMGDKVVKKGLAAK